jgi:hypothetical protein
MHLDGSGRVVRGAGPSLRNGSARPAAWPSGREAGNVPENSRGGKANVATAPRVLAGRGLWPIAEAGWLGRGAAALSAVEDVSPDRGVYDIIVVPSNEGTIA